MNNKKLYRLSLIIVTGLFSHFAQAQKKEITMLIAYSNQAACSAGGVDKIKTNVDYGLTLLNKGLNNSNIGYNVRILPQYAEVELSFVGSKAAVDDLIGELPKPDGKFNKIHQLRKQLRADMVCLVYTGYAMGKAQLDGDFMVCEKSVFDDSWIFPHEFGHNLGATHEAGMRFEINRNTYRTISNNGGYSIPYYSDDRTITYNIEGADRQLKLGDAQHNNSATMRANAPKRASAGDNLADLADIPGAFPAKLVDPNTTPMPSGCTRAIPKYLGCNQSSTGLIKVFYSAVEGVPLTIELIDKDGNNVGGGSTSAPAGEPVYEKGPFGLYSGDKAFIIFDGQRYACVLNDGNSPVGSPIKAGGTTPTTPTTPTPVTTTPPSATNTKTTTPSQPTTATLPPTKVYPLPPNLWHRPNYPAYLQANH